MRFSEFCFVDTATSGLASRSDVRKIQEWTQICLSGNLGLPQGQKEWYRSWFRFPASLESYWRNNKNSVAGYRGEHILDFLFIDVEEFVRDGYIEDSELNGLRGLNITDSVD